MDERSPFDFPLLFFLRSPLPFHLIISVLDKKPPPPAQLKGHKGKKIVIIWKFPFGNIVWKY